MWCGSPGARPSQSLLRTTEKVTPASQTFKPRGQATPSRCATGGKRDLAAGPVAVPDISPGNGNAPPPPIAADPAVLARLSRPNEQRPRPGGGPLPSGAGTRDGPGCPGPGAGGPPPRAGAKGPRRPRPRPVRARRPPRAARRPALSPRSRGGVEPAGAQKGRPFTVLHGRPPRLPVGRGPPDPSLRCPPPPPPPPHGWCGRSPAGRMARRGRADSASARGLTPSRAIIAAPSSPARRRRGRRGGLGSPTISGAWCGER